MANSKISALTSATTPLAGTETLPIVQSSTTKQVTVANLTAGRDVAAQSITLTAVSPATPSVTSLLIATIDRTVGVTGFGLATAYGGTASFSFRRAEGTFASPTATTGTSINIVGATTSDGTTFVSTTSIVAGVEGTPTTGSHATYVAISTSPSGSAARVERLRVNAAGDVLAQTGNFVPSTAAKGVNFTANTPAAGMTSQLLNWYEEGTWTPSTTFLTIVGTASSSGTYTRIGRQVTIRGVVAGSTSVTVGASGILTTGFPYSAAADSIGQMAASTNTASGEVRVTGPYVVATTTIAPVPSITFTATYFV